jgi:uncharacterized protein
MDNVAYDIITSYEDLEKDDLACRVFQKYVLQGVSLQDVYECIRDVEDLKENGQLFAQDIYEDKAALLKTNSAVVKALCLHVAHTCNLNCTYCFASQGKYHGERALMSFEVGKQALDFLITNSGTRRNLEVDFFGGEPLMNWDVVKKLVKYGRDQEKEHNKCFRYTLTTNGVLVDDEVIEFCNQEMYNVVLSLDGRKEVHDRLRKDYAGNGSYDKIVPKFQKFASRREGKKATMSAETYTHYNTDFTKDLFHMADLGFFLRAEHGAGGVSAGGIRTHLRKKICRYFSSRYRRFLQRIMLKRKKTGNGFTFYHYMLDLEHGPCIYKRLSGCGSGTEYLAVTPWGELFPCHQFVGDSKYSMGDVWSGIKNKNLQEKFRKCNVYSRPECKKLLGKLYCSGGCAANAYHATGDITGIYEYGCELFRKRIECAIMIKVAESADLDK